MRSTHVRTSHTRSSFVGYAASLLVLLSGCGSPGEVCSEDAGTRADASLAERDVEDRVDTSEAPLVHAVYMVPLDGVDRHRDVDRSIDRSLDEVQRYLRAETGRSLRLDRFDGRIDATFVQATFTPAELTSSRDPRRLIDAQLTAAGLRRRDRLYLVYVQGRHETLAGVAARPPLASDEDTGILSASIFLESSCLGFGSGLTKWEYLTVHEILHALGAVPACDENPTSVHVLDETDVMRHGSLRSDTAYAIDPGRDEYWGHGRADCPDAARSVFVINATTPLAWPPGWAP